MKNFLKGGRPGEVTDKPLTVPINNPFPPRKIPQSIYDCRVAETIHSSEA